MYHFVVIYLCNFQLLFLQDSGKEGGNFHDRHFSELVAEHFPLRTVESLTMNVVDLSASIL